jgi:hypothetical protein
MKNRLFRRSAVAVAAAAVSFGSLAFSGHNARAQSAIFQYNQPSGNFVPGSSFTLSLSVVFTSGGTINNLEGLSYWFQTQNPVPPFYFAISNRVFGASLFTDAQTPGIVFPQQLNPQTANDLGALSAAPQPNGTYFVADLTFTVSPSAAPGAYVVQNITSGGKTSVITDSDGDTFPIPAANFTINVVPEPGTLALTSTAVLLAGGLAWRKRRNR